MDAPFKLIGEGVIPVTEPLAIPSVMRVASPTYNTPNTPDLGHSPTGSRRSQNKNLIDFGMDIGGTLSKLVFLERKDVDPSSPSHDNDFAVQRRKMKAFIKSSLQYGETGERDPHFETHFPALGGKLHFIKFHTQRMPEFAKIVNENKLILSPEYKVGATGGGAVKFEDLFQNELGIKLLRYDELDCLLKGINFLLKNYKGECYYFKIASVDDQTKMKLEESPASTWGDDMYPYLVVNIGSGVSILKVSGEGKFERVGGTSLGGSTFFGLCTLLTGCNSFSEALQLADKGNHRNVDMLVRDIYGGNYKTFNLPSDTIASSFGKMIKPETAQNVRKEDLARSTLMTITNNIASIAHLQAKLHGATKILFAGNFLARNEISMRLIAYGLDYWSQGNIKALFLEHEGYFGAIGALLTALEEK